MNQFNSNDAEKKLRDVSAELQAQEYKLSSVNEEMAVLNRQSSSRAKLDINQSELERKKTSLLKVQQDARHDFESILGASYDAKTLEDELKLAFR